MVEEVVKRARGKSAPGPNGVPYLIYKRCPKVLRMHQRLLYGAWKEGEWKKADGVFIAIELNSSEISQFRPISLLNVEGKMFFAVMLRRITNYLVENDYINSMIQKGGIPGIPGCLEHASMIWEAAQRAKRDKLDLNVIWLDLANAYSSVPHQLLWLALEIYCVPPNIVSMLRSYFTGFQLWFTTAEYTTDWTELEIDIAMGCSFHYPLIMAMQLFSLV
jgi:hypothetical protein